MKRAFEAIKNVFAISGLNLYLGEAPQSASIPYAIYYIFDGGVDDERSSFEKTAYTHDIQFSIYADTAADILDYQTKIHAIYDDLDLEVSGFDIAIMVRTSASNAHQDGENYMADSLYTYIVRKS